MSWLLLAVPRLVALAWAVSSCGSSRVAVALHGAAGALVVGVVEKSVVCMMVRTTVVVCSDRDEELSMLMSMKILVVDAGPPPP